MNHRAEIVKKVNTMAIGETYQIGQFKIERRSRTQYLVVRDHVVRSYNMNEMNRITNDILTRIENEPQTTKRGRRNKVKKTKTIKVNRKRLNRKRKGFRVFKTVLNVLFQLVMLTAVFGLLTTSFDIAVKENLVFMIVGGMALISVMIQFAATRRNTLGLKRFNVIFAFIILGLVIAFLIKDNAFAFPEVFGSEVYFDILSGRPGLLILVSSFVNFILSLANKTRK